jgi:hypothetical protein
VKAVSRLTKGRRVAREDRERKLASRHLKQRTRLLALFAGASVLGVFGVEFARIWRLGRMPAKRSSDHLLSEGRRTTGQLWFVAREGLRVTSMHENTLFSMLGSFLMTFGIARSITYSIRVRGRAGPFRDVHLGSQHIHHFVPGVVISFVSGGISIVSRSEKIDRWAAVPFGAGVALVLDEAALLLELEDVYWAEEGRFSIDIAFGAVCLLASLAYAVRLLRRGEARAREADWMTAARAFDDLILLPGATRSER